MNSTEILKYYRSKLNPETRYVYPAKTRQNIDRLLKDGFTAEQLITSIDVYAQEKNPQYTKSPCYFFSVSPVSKDYHFFETYLQDDLVEKLEQKEQRKIVDPLSKFL